MCNSPSFNQLQAILENINPTPNPIESLETDSQNIFIRTPSLKEKTEFSSIGAEKLLKRNLMFHFKYRKTNDDLIARQGNVTSTSAIKKPIPKNFANKRRRVRGDGIVHEQVDNSKEKEKEITGYLNLTQVYSQNNQQLQKILQNSQIIVSLIHLL